jgi:hypothetical protein
MLVAMYMLIINREKRWEKTNLMFCKGHWT